MDMAGCLRATFKVLQRSSRSLATTTTLPQVAPSQPDGALRPHLRVPVNPNHGLYGFFRVKTDRNSNIKPTESGGKEYVALEPPIPPALRPSGRAWEATELRRKSFKDLHTLWYILLRERNLLATQAAEKKRIQAAADPNAAVKTRSCRKSMARIKLVISERRFAYKDALRLRRAQRRANAELESGAPAVMHEGENPTQSMLENEEKDEDERKTS